MVKHYKEKQPPPEFFDAMEKIVRGILESNFDISKVKKCDLFSLLEDRNHE